VEAEVDPEEAVLERAYRAIAEFMKEHYPG